MTNLVRPYSLFEDFYRPFDSMFSQPALQAAAERNRWYPPVDITKTDEEFTITMELPGFDREQLTIEAHDGVLSIEGERSSAAESEDGFVRRERQYGKFVRRFSLPAGTDENGIAADVKEGILTIKIPHARPATPKKISIA